MASETFFSTVSGLPITANTSIAKDVGIYHCALDPCYATLATLKKSSAPPRCLAVSPTHIFTAQAGKAHVHVYSRARNTQESLVPFPEKITCLALAGSVLVLGTAQGRLILWETTTGRTVSTPARHVQGVSCLAVAGLWVLSGSDDSDVNVWNLGRVLDVNTSEVDLERSLSNHRGGITDLATNLGDGANTQTSIAVSASKDKTCIVWNYHTGTVLRTILFPTAPLCAALTPSCTGLIAACEDGSLHLVEFFAETPVLGPRSAEMSSIAIQAPAALGMADVSETGPSVCMAVSYDGTRVLTGHARGRILQWGLEEGTQPVELAGLNACVTNLVFVSPFKESVRTRPGMLMRPVVEGKRFTVTTQLVGGQAETRAGRMLRTPGFEEGVIREALEAWYGDGEDEFGRLAREQGLLQLGPV